MPLAIDDVFCGTLGEAMAEIGRRKRGANADGMITRFEESPYGGYRVYSVPADFAVDELVDPIYPGARIGLGCKRLYR